MASWVTVAFALGGLASADFLVAWQVGLSQPLVTGWVVGVLLGDPVYGITVGAVLQLMWIAEIPVGGVRLHDLSTAGVCGSIVAVVSKTALGFPPGLSLAFSLVAASSAAVLGGWLIEWTRKTNSRIAERTLVDESKLSGIVAMGVIKSFLAGGLLSASLTALWLSMLSLVSEHTAAASLAFSSPFVYAAAAFGIGVSYKVIGEKVALVGLGFLTVVSAHILGMV